MQKVKLIQSDYPNLFQDKLNEFVQKKDIIIHQIQFNTPIECGDIVYLALIIYTEKKEGENNEL